jgi:hypothetical protein
MQFRNRSNPGLEQRVKAMDNERWTINLETRAGTGLTPAIRSGRSASLIS